MQSFYKGLFNRLSGCTILAFCAVMCPSDTWGKEVRDLTSECGVYDIPKKNGVWNLSVYNVIGSDRTNRAVILGDTIYSETIGGYRINYGLMNETILSVQSRFGAIVIDSCFQANAGGDKSLAGYVRYAGEDCYPVTGEWLRSESERGMLIGFENDTVYDVTSQTDVITLNIGTPDNNEPCVVRIERCRWFAADDSLPLAVATRSGNVDNSGKYNPTLSLLCSGSIDRHKTRRGINDRAAEDESRASLENMSVGYSGGLITVGGSMPENRVPTAAGCSPFSTATAVTPPRWSSQPPTPRWLLLAPPYVRPNIQAATPWAATR